MVWSFPKSGGLLNGKAGLHRFGRQDCLEGAEAGMSARRSGGEPVGEKRRFAVRHLPSGTFHRHFETGSGPPRIDCI
jgi:hypothetical protein